MNTNNQAQMLGERVALYIDGFNLYHAIDNLRQPHLKWSNYWMLGEIIIPSRSQRLVRTVYCTAYYPGDNKKRWRHEQFIGAQKVCGVDVIIGRFASGYIRCTECNNRWEKPTEKEGDINVALNLICDAFNDVFDHAYLLSSDSDHAATARMFQQYFPEKRRISVAPPGREPSVNIMNYVDDYILLNEHHFERCVMPAVVFEPGVANTRRPREYDPPADWVHPDQRPQ